MNPESAIHQLRRRIESGVVFSSATLHEASGQQGALPPAIKPVAMVRQIVGSAFTVQTPPGDNLWVHRAIYAAQPGDVLVVDTRGGYESGYWGEIMTHAALERSLGGLVIDGCVRDLVRLRNLGLPIFARGLSIRATTKDERAHGAMGRPLNIGGTSISPRDLIFGDEDGVVVIPQDHVGAVLDAAEERVRKESDVIAALKAGTSTIEIFQLRPTGGEDSA